MTVAAAAIALLALSAAPAMAGFRYVPPAEAEAAAEPAETLGPEKGSDAGAGEIEPRPGPGLAVTGTSVTGTNVTGTSVWRVRAGETLRETLARWGARAGTDVLFLTDRRYRLEGAASFEGAFGEAARSLFGALGHLPHPPEGGLSEDGGSLVVTHRLPMPRAGGGKP